MSSARSRIVSSAVSWIALVASLTAIFLYINQPKRLTEADVQIAVNAALVKREKAFVAKNAPVFKELFAEVFADMGRKNWDPQTLDELLEPLLKVLAEMGNL